MQPKSKVLISDKVDGIIASVMCPSPPASGKYSAQATGTSGHSGNTMGGIPTVIIRRKLAE